MSREQLSAHVRKPRRSRTAKQGQEFRSAVGAPQARFAALDSGARLRRPPNLRGGRELRRSSECVVRFYAKLRRATSLGR